MFLGRLTTAYMIIFYSRLTVVLMRESLITKQLIMMKLTLIDRFVLISPLPLNSEGKVGSSNMILSGSPSLIIFLNRPFLILSPRLIGTAAA